MGNLTLTQADIENIVAVATKAAIEVYQEQEAKAREKYYSNTLFNAKKLMYNYRNLKKMVGSSVYDGVTTTNEDLQDLLKFMEGHLNYNIEAASIKRSTIKTKVMLEHVDTMLKAYQLQCMQSKDSGTIRRYRIIKMLHLDEKQVSRSKIAEMEKISVSTVSRDADSVYEEIAVLLFGIDGIKLKHNA